MARKHGKNAAIYVDEFNLSGYSNTWTLNINVDTAEVTSFADTSKEFLEGDHGGDFSWGGFFDTTDDGWDETTWDQAVTSGGQHYGGLAPYGTSAGSTVYEVYGLYTAQTRSAPVADAITLDGSIVGDEAGRGLVLLDATISSTGAQTSQDYGAKGAGETLMVVYRIESLNGAGNIVMDIEESSDNGAADAFAAIADLASGTLTSTGVTAKTTTAATEQYLRVNVTTFGPTSAVIYVTVTTLA